MLSTEYRLGLKRHANRAGHISTTVLTLDVSCHYEIGMSS